MARMTARYSGTCRDCGNGFAAGTLIDYTKRAPRGKKTAHANCDDPGVAVTVEIAEDFYGTAQESARGVSYRNYGGRCEDAPCCGCCTPFGPI